MAGGYRFLDHMTDAVIEAYGGTLEEAFENAARALNDTMVDLRTVTPDREIEIEASGSDLYSLLFDWLDKVMLLLVADHIVMSEFKIEKIRQDAGGFSLRATAKGERLDLGKHKYKVEIKAVTYHEMQVTVKEGGGAVPAATVRFLLDL